ncbi:hypothetical protein V6N11_083977 [Hibiscus sabdariffa]|uniref:Uncharacterized protein n=1 Tax=Hibiscus sabdariffa TaxID=183260 RepID=A0ABR2QD47_9ROSI
MVSSPETEPWMRYPIKDRHVGRTIRHSCELYPSPFSIFLFLSPIPPSPSSRRKISKRITHFFSSAGAVMGLTLTAVLGFAYQLLGDSAF